MAEKENKKTLKNIGLKVSPLFILLAFIMAIFGAILEFISYTIVIIIHEFAHASVAHRRGYFLDGISLMPYGANLTGAFEGVRERDEVAIALAGPIINIILAVIFICLWWLFPSLYLLTFYFVYANIYTALFNLLPIFPLDGGRVFLALLSKKFPREKVYRLQRYVGYFFSVAFALLFVASMFYGINFSFGTISVFVFISTLFPDKNSKYQRLYSLGFRGEKIKKGIVQKTVIVSQDAKIITLLKMLNSTYFYKFVVVDMALKQVCEIDELRLEAIAAKNDLYTAIKNVI